MRAWTRAVRPVPCGNCPQMIPVGAVLLEIGEAKLVRCETCAVRMFGEPAPELLPAMEAPRHVRHPDFVTATALARSWPDVRQRQTGEP